MKRRKGSLFIGTVLIISLSTGVYLQHGRKMMAYSSFSSSFENFHEEKLNVVLNKLYLFDKKNCSQEIVVKCRENNFPNIMFSYDVRLPNALYVTVYLSEWNMRRGNPLFSFRYTQKEGQEKIYNIVDNPEYFKLEID